MMYRAVCQPDGAHGGGPLSLPVSKYTFFTQQEKCESRVCVCVVGGGERVDVFAQAEASDCGIYK